MYNKCLNFSGLKFAPRSTFSSFQIFYQEIGARSAQKLANLMIFSWHVGVFVLTSCQETSTKSTFNILVKASLTVFSACFQYSVLNSPLFCRSHKPCYLLSYPNWFFFSSLILLEGGMRKILEFLSSASLLKFIGISWLYSIPFLKLWAEFAALSLHMTIFSLCLEIVLTLKAQCAKPIKKIRSR